jgi:hypothetical protein
LSRGGRQDVELVVQTVKACVDSIEGLLQPASYGFEPLDLHALLEREVLALAKRVDDERLPLPLPNQVRPEDAQEYSTREHTNTTEPSRGGRPAQARSECEDPGSALNRRALAAFLRRPSRDIGQALTQEGSRTLEGMSLENRLAPPPTSLLRLVEMLDYAPHGRGCVV